MYSLACSGLNSRRKKIEYKGQKSAARSHIVYIGAITHMRVCSDEIGTGVTGSTGVNSLGVVYGIDTKLCEFTTIQYVQQSAVTTLQTVLAD